MSHSEQERNKIFLAFDRALTDAMLLAQSQGMLEKDVMDYSVRQAGDHIIHTFGISLEEATSIVREGAQRKGCSINTAQLGYDAPKVERPNVFTLIKVAFVEGCVASVLFNLAGISLFFFDFFGVGIVGLAAVAGVLFVKPRILEPFIGAIVGLFVTLSTGGVLVAFLCGDDIMLTVFAVVNAVGALFGAFVFAFMRARNTARCLGT